MNTQFSKYSQPQDLANIDIVNDNRVPFSYRTWTERNVGILPGKERLQYEKYLKNWYETKKKEIPTKEFIKKDYIQLLKQLTVTFKTEAEKKWVSDINFDDDNEIVQAIPFYVTKLKEIAIYLVNKREAIRRAKLKYNLTGTYAALERVFYEYLLKAFTKRKFPGNEYITNITDVAVLTTIPELSAVKSSFQIIVDELYDDASYFDHDPKMPVSSYYTFNNDATAYLDNLNITPDQYEWLYSTGVAALCADNPLLWSVDRVLDQYKNGIPLSAVELNDSDLLNDYNRIKLAKKYLGESQYILSGGYWVPWINTIQYNFNAGNNWFYWLTGENLFENDTTKTFDPIKLNESNLIKSGATASDNIYNSDIIFFMRDNSLSGAWLKHSDQNTFNAIMSARLDKGKTIFAFPYPGFGLTGEDLEWTGKSLSNLDRTFLYLSPNEKKAVFETYWDTTITSTSSFEPLYIYDTTLIENGTKAAKQFDQADYIVTRDTLRDFVRDFVYTDNQEYAWLYKMIKTDIPVAGGLNNIYWPFERYDTNIVMVASANQCNPINLSEIPMSDFLGAVAGFTPEDADKIFKRPSPNSSDYTEGAWLYGHKYSPPLHLSGAYMASGCYQPNLALFIAGGAYGSFIWNMSSMHADSVFINAQHQDDCLYLTRPQFSLYKERPTQQKELDYDQWKMCSCRAISYSPLGHPGATFDEYEGTADFIIALTEPISSFNFKDWKGVDGLNYTKSTSFGWYRLNKNYAIEPDVGWGSGNWVTNTGEPFMLSSNVMYLYYRNDMHRDSPNASVPYYVCKYKNTFPNTKNAWRKLIFNKNLSEWVDAGVITDMVINAGDRIVYDHQMTSSITLTASHYEFRTQKVPVIPDMNNYALTSVIGMTNLKRIDTTIPIQDLDPSKPLSATNVITVCDLPLTYYTMPEGPIMVSGSFGSTIPFDTTMVSTMSTITSIVIDHYTYTNNSINFMLNVKLNGWDYGEGETGGRPFWAIASDKDDDFTKRKGIDIWSGSPVLVDEYNFKTQPPFSNMKFTTNKYIEYNKRNIGTIYWKQPVTVNVKEENRKWCDILINRYGISNLSAVLFNTINELVITATNNQSNMAFEIIQDKPLLINYFARIPFTWTQDISNSSLGLPPTGGVWIPIETSELIHPDVPYAHLSNRHYPTYATVPSLADLYSVKDSGGYFIPKMLGASTAVSKNITNEIDTTRINNNQDKRGVTSIYQDLDIYYSDRGLSNTDQFSTIKHIDTDSSWMKASITEGMKSGLITESQKAQEFMPYQTRYENMGINDNGIYRQGQDSYDPWYGAEDIAWENSVDWPPNWRKQYNIKGWYDQLNKGSLQVYQWKTDIFGNQYALLKGDKFHKKSIYDKKHIIPGEIWTRDSRNIIQRGIVSLADVFKDIHPPELAATGGYETLDTIVNGISTYTTHLTAGVLDIDVWFDTLMLYTSSGLYFYHLNFDFANNKIYSNADEINYIITKNSIFGGTWLHETEKVVTICTLLSCEDQIRPILRQLDLETNKLKIIYNLSSEYTDMSKYKFNRIDHPVFTYDKKTKTYNVSYASYNSEVDGMHLTTINIRDFGDYYDIISAKTITPISVQNPFVD